MNPSLAAGWASRLQDSCRTAEIFRQTQRLLRSLFILPGHIRAVLCHHPVSHALCRGTRGGKPAVDLRADRNQAVSFLKPSHAFIFLTGSVVTAAHAQKTGTHQYIHLFLTFSRQAALYQHELCSCASLLHVSGSKRDAARSNVFQNQLIPFPEAAPEAAVSRLHMQPEPALGDQYLSAVESQDSGSPSRIQPVHASIQPQKRAAAESSATWPPFRHMDRQAVFFSARPSAPAPEIPGGQAFSPFLLHTGPAFLKRKPFSANIKKTSRLTAGTPSGKNEPPHNRDQPPVHPGLQAYNNAFRRKETVSNPDSLLFSRKAHRLRRKIKLQPFFSQRRPYGCLRSFVSTDMDRRNEHRPPVPAFHRVIPADPFLPPCVPD